jgi:hypothetical protein
VRYLDTSADHGFDHDGNRLLHAFECRANSSLLNRRTRPLRPRTAPPSPRTRYTVREPKSELLGAAAKYGGRAYYAVCSIEAIVHRAPLVPSPTRWSPGRDRGAGEDVCDVWYLLEDLLWHTASRRRSAVREARGGE